MTGLQAARMSGNGIVEKQLFSEFLRYYDTTDNLATPLYSGKIAQIDWKRKLSFDGLDRFLYSYDPLGRLTKAEHRITGLDGSTRGSYTQMSTFDLNSNILSQSAAKGLFIEQQNFTLNGNRIVTASTGPMGQYTAEYDNRGNLTRIPGENLQIAYNL